VSRPKRLKFFDYRGSYAYFLTFCAFERQKVFASENAVTCVMQQFLRTAAERDFEVLAYTFMPDHLHLLVQGRTDDADLRRFCKAARQRATVALNRGRTLWQDGFFEHTLRADEDVEIVAMYIAANPVRAGLVEDASMWPHSGGILLERLWNRTTEP
jgi:putative transposase